LRPARAAWSKAKHPSSEIGSSTAATPTGWPFSGSRGWTPVLLEIGPIDDRAGHLSYGFNLEGGGDIWVYDPKLEIVANRSPDTTDEDLFLIGRVRD
jgi:hypothetical protein